MKWSINLYFNYFGSNALSLIQSELWDYSLFDYDYLEGEEIPLLRSNWESFPLLENLNKDKGIEIRNMILRSLVYFNMTR